jgi:hypothetical protein
MNRSKPARAVIDQPSVNLSHAARGVRVGEHKRDVTLACVAWLPALVRGFDALALGRCSSSSHLKGIMSGDERIVEYTLITHHPVFVITFDIHLSNTLDNMPVYSDHI